MRQLGGALGVAASSAAFAAAGGYGSPGGAFRAALAVTAVLALAGAAAGLPLPGRPGLVPDPAARAAGSPPGHAEQGRDRAGVSEPAFRSGSSAG